MLLDNIYLILLLPLWLFLIIMLGRFFSVYVRKTIIFTLTLLSSFLGILLSSAILWKISPDQILESSFTFLKINNFTINYGLHVDKIALIFALVLFLISFFVQIFSISYMKEEKKSYRFYALMNLFNFSMLGLFFSPNLFQTYFFWELAGVVSYLLIGFEYFKKEKSIASKKVFLINRIGDTALLTAILFCSHLIFSYAPNNNLAMLSFIDLNVISTLVYAYASSPLYEIICCLFIIGILVKSAQFPFYNWLQYAMEAKLPVSALLHSSTLVAAGVFLTIKILPFLTLEPITLKILAIIGLVTALICSLSACAQSNPKKVLAYSTSAQFGLIYLGIGVLNIKSALIFFIAHAFIKSVLFITLPDENQKWNYIKFVIFLISGLSLSGLLLSGMIAKEIIATNLPTNGIILFSIISFLTAFYIIRIALVLFDSNKTEKSKLSVTEILAISGLLLLNIGFYLYLHKTAQYKIAEPFWAALTAWIITYILYIKNAFWRVPILYTFCNNGFFLDKIYTYFSKNVYQNFTNTCKIIEEKVLSNYTLEITSAKIGIKTFGIIENKIMNGTTKLVKEFLKKISITNKKFQTGNIQKYNAYAFIIITLILICLILCYSLIMIHFGG